LEKTSKIFTKFFLLTISSRIRKMFNSFLKSGVNKPELVRMEGEIVESLGTAVTLGADTGKLLASINGDVESLGDKSTDFIAGVEEAEAALVDAGYPTFLKTLLANGAEISSISDEDPRVQNGMAAATAILVAGQAPEEYMEAFLKQPHGGADNTIMVGNASGFDAEAFDEFKFDKFTVKSALTAGVIATTSPFSQTFFKTAVLPAGQNGLDMRVTIPETYKRYYRPGTGVPSTIARKSLVRAALDHTILLDNSTDIIPVSDAARNPRLVATLPARQVEQHGVQFDSRPIQYNVEVDLVDISTNAGLIKVGAMTEQDTLDPYVSLGRQVLNINDGTNDIAVEVDIDGLPGTMINYLPEGNVRDMGTNARVRVWIHSTDLDYAGNVLSAGLDTTGLAWLTGDYRLEVELMIHAMMDMDGNLVVNPVEFTPESIKRVQFGTAYGTTADATQLAALQAALTLTGLGYFPVARRSNSNMRDVGTIVDTGRTYNYRLAAPLGAPLTSVKPVAAMGNGVSLDGLSSVARLRNIGTAVTTLLDFEKKLIATQELEDTQAAAIGGILIKPTHLKTTLNVDTMVRNRDSRHGQEDLSVHLVNAITMHANRMIVDAGYMPALEMYTGSRGNFEVIITTDPIIANLIMTSGDGRTLGNGRRFKVTEMDDERMRGKIYISLARTDVSGPDVMSFGAHITVPPLVHQAQVTVNGSTHNQTQLVPRDSFHVTLPILGRIDVTNLEDFYLQV
jgi:hypothetical protein